MDSPPLHVERVKRQIARVLESCERLNRATTSLKREHKGFDISLVLDSMESNRFGRACIGVTEWFRRETRAGARLCEVCAWPDNIRKSLYLSRKGKIMGRPCDTMADAVAPLLLACRSGIEGQLFLMFLRLPFVGACRGRPLVRRYTRFASWPIIQSFSVNTYVQWDKFDLTYFSIFSLFRIFERQTRKRIM